MDVTSSNSNPIVVGFRKFANSKSDAFSVAFTSDSDSTFVLKSLLS